MKKWWIWITILIIVLTIGTWASMRRSTPTSVTVVTIAPQTVEETVTCTGVIEAVDGTAVSVPIQCVVESVEVKNGQRVKVGDVIATINREQTRASLENEGDVVVLAAMDESVTAPIDGIVVSLKAGKGQPLEQGAPCAVIAREEDLRIRVLIREKHLRSLKKGMAVRVSGDGLNKKFYKGTLSEIASVAKTDVSTGTVVEGWVTLLPGEADESLRLGLSAKATVITSVEEDGLVVPFEAVITDEDGSYVYVVDGNTAKRMQVEVSRQVATGVLLENRQLEGKSVIQQPDKVSDGQPILWQEERQ